MKNISLCSQKLGKTGVETSAYYRALGESKGLNMDKHHGDVENEVNAEAAEEDSEYTEFLKFC